MENQNTTQSTELAHFEVTEAALAEIKQFQSLTIAGLDDKEGYEKVRVALRDVVSIRNKVVKRRQDIKRQIDNGAKYILDNIAPVETHLAAQKQAIDGEKERIKQADAERKQKQFVDRTSQLFALGFQFNGSIYTLGDMMLSVADIHERDAEQWSGTMDRANTVAEDIRAKKAAEEAARKAEQEAKDRELEELRKKLAEANAQLGKPEPAYQRPAAKDPLAAIPAIQPAQTEAPAFFPEPEGQSHAAAAHQQILEQPVPTSFVPALNATYVEGFNTCKAKVLAIMADPTKRTRAEFIQLIEQLKP